MQRTEREYYQPTPAKQHENKMQELHHERKTESRRLECLKKVLESKLAAAAQNTEPLRAA